MPAILRLQEAATSHLGLRERVGNPIGGERSGTVLATRSALTGSNRPLPRARTAAQEIIVGRAAAPATSGRLRRQSRKAPDQPVVVRKILKLLEREGLVASSPRPPRRRRSPTPASGITLGQIYKAVESESGVFAMRSQVHDRCVVACAMKRKLGPIFNAANDAVEQALSKTSLLELVRGVG